MSSVLLPLLLVPPAGPFAHQVHAAGTLVPLPLVSRGVPAYTNDDCYGSYPASRANDGDYTTLWRSCQRPPSASSPIWLAYDLSQAQSVTGGHLGRVIVAWYNDPVSGDYDTSYNTDAYNIVATYSLEANAAPGGTAPPATGWVTLVGPISGNIYHSRQHLVDLTGYSWLRLRATASSGAVGNSDIALNLDVQDASQVPAGAPASDDWIFYGDSITAAGMSHGGGAGVGSFAQLIHAADPAYSPVQEDGGVGYLTSGSGAADVPGWLSLFPGTYVGLSYGGNDALGGCSASQLSSFSQHYETMIQAVLARGGVPVIPHLDWAPNSMIQSCGPKYNAQIDALVAAYPQVVPGPDLWTFFQSNPGLISSDGIHPTDAGYGAYRQQWANAMLARVYHPPAVPTSTSTPVPTDTPTPSPTPTSTPIPTDTPTPSPTPTNTPVPTATLTPSPTATSTPVPTDTPTPSATSTPVPTDTLTPSSTATNTSVPTSALTYTTQAGAGWNMVGGSPLNLWSDSSVDWAWNASSGQWYHPASDSSGGTGAWEDVNTAGPRTVTVSQCPSPVSVSVVAHRWNLVGNPCSTRVTLPGTARAYWWDPSANHYDLVTSINPGAAAWVKPDATPLVLTPG